MVGLLVMGFDPDSKGLSWVEGDRIEMGFLVDHSVYISPGQHFHFLSLQVVLPLLLEEEDEETGNVKRRHFGLRVILQFSPEVSAPIQFGPWNLISCNLDPN
jgi:hypothetical protein